MVEFTSTPQYIFMAWCLIKFKDKAAFVNMHIKLKV
jgi:hypothetical protein